MFLSLASCAAQIERFMSRAQENASAVCQEPDDIQLGSHPGSLPYCIPSEGFQKPAIAWLALGTAIGTLEAPSAIPASPPPLLASGVTYRIPYRHMSGRGSHALQPAGTPSRSNFCLYRQTLQGLDWPGGLQTFPAPWNHLRRTTWADIPLLRPPVRHGQGLLITATPADAVVSVQAWG